MNLELIGKTSKKVIDNIRSLPLPLLYVIISIIILCVYWFIALFLFKRQFYIENPIGIIIMFCFGFSFTWFMLSLFISMLFTKNKESISADATIFASGFSSVFWLCFSLLVTYVLKRLCHWSDCFDNFLLLSYGYLVFLLVKTAIVYHWEKCTKSKNPKEQPTKTQ